MYHNSTPDMVWSEASAQPGLSPSTCQLLPLSEHGFATVLWLKGEIFLGEVNNFKAIDVHEDKRSKCTWREGLSETLPEGLEKRSNCQVSTLRKPFQVGDSQRWGLWATATQEAHVYQF